MKPQTWLARTLSMAKLLGVVVAVVPAVAVADHHHGAVSSVAQPAFSAGVSLVAAQFDTMEYGGAYQGMVPAVQWTHGRFAATASAGVYRLEKNGLELYGAGDTVVHGQARAIERGGASAGVALALSVPTGDSRQGLGMGHVMAMPAAYVRWGNEAVGIDGSVGYGHAVGGDGHHVHGGPLIEPMNQQEITFTAGGDVALARRVRAGGRVSGAAPVGSGTTRVIGGARVRWSDGRVETAFELQAGLAGDPFTVRGVLETALRF